MKAELSSAMDAALKHLAMIETFDPDQASGFHPRAGWLQTSAATIRALERRGYIEPCDAHVPIYFPPIENADAGRGYLVGRERHFYRLTDKGQRHIAIGREIAEGLR